MGAEHGGRGLGGDAVGAEGVVRHAGVAGQDDEAGLPDTADGEFGEGR
ncbi:hypothetical protein ABT288_04980 [Streptomyces sp. NPDC001093]